MIYWTQKIHITLLSINIHVNITIKRQEPLHDKTVVLSELYIEV